MTNKTIDNDRRKKITITKEQAKCVILALTEYNKFYVVESMKTEVQAIIDYIEEQIEKTENEIKRRNNGIVENFYIVLELCRADVQNIMIATRYFRYRLLSYEDFAIMVHRKFEELTYTWDDIQHYKWEENK